MQNKATIQPHAKRKGWLKNGNTPGDLRNVLRCGAKTRKGIPCRGPAMANGRCRMHGGKSTGAPLGNNNALKHGQYTKDAIELRKNIGKLLRDTALFLSRVNEEGNC